MKILAVRGENIASLAGKFAVDFNGEQLGEHGLIAISGKTGAGKSSLLDCMCLALYEQVPRFTHSERSVEVGSESESQKLKANDVRHLISRGKSEGMAEVDFIGADGQHYRASWHARRARNQLDGRWQQAHRELISLSDNRVSTGNKRELQSEIDKLIGLDYAQFRRAVLLAQGEFAAFLKAGSDERAALLERMTGTELYSQISQQVFQRAKDHKNALDQLQAQLGNVNLLDDEQLAEMHAQLEALDTQLKHIESLQGQLLEQNQRLQQLDQLHMSETKLQQQRDELNAQQARMQQIDLQLQQYQQLSPLAALRAQLRQLQTQAERIVQQGEEANTKLTALREQQAQLSDLQAQAHTEKEHFAASKAQNEAACDKAKELEMQARNLAAQIAELNQTRTQLSQQSGELTRNLHSLDRQREQITREQQQLQAWLGEHQGWGNIAERPQWLEQTLGQWQSLQQHFAQAQHGINETQQQQENNFQQQAKVQHYIEQLKEQAQVLGEQVQRVDEAAYEGLTQGIAKAKQQLHAWDQSLPLLNAFANCAVQLQAQTDELHALTAQQQAHQALCIDLKTKSESTQLSLNEAEFALQQSYAVLSLSEHRAGLRPDEACPLCGATEHPYREHAPEVDAIVQGQNARVQALRQTLKQINHEWAQSDGELSRLQHVINELRQQQAQLKLRQDELSGDLAPPWQTLAFDVFMQELDGLKQEHQRVSEQLHRDYHSLQQWQILRAQQYKIEQQLSQLHEQLNAAQHKQGFLLEQSEHLALHLKEWQARIEQLQTQLAQVQQSLDENLSATPWQQWMRQGGLAQCLHYCQQVREQYAQCKARENTLSDALSQHAQQHAQLSAQQEQMVQQMAQMDANLAQQQSAWQRIEAERAPLLDGLSIAQFKAREHEREMQLQQQAEQLAKQAEFLTAQLSQWQTRLQDSEQERNHLEAQQEQLHTRWHKDLGALGLDDALAVSLLDTSPAQWQSLQKTQQDYQQQCIENANSLHSNSSQQQEVVVHVEAAQAHLQQALQALGLSQQGELNQFKQQQQELVYRLRGQLAQHHSALEQAAVLTQSVQAKQQEFETWEQLNNLIGSSSGAKFRTFAQQLTLENLLYEANVQLAALSPRYCLQRVPNSALAIQVVDKDMGDEVRAIASLSGGETFLVSLALALALSGMAGGQLQIRSLFIDEGFGSLDPESLDIAMACLDNLQASGRQVAVISHVQALVERVAAKVILRPLGAGRSELSVQVA